MGPKERAELGYWYKCTSMFTFLKSEWEADPSRFQNPIYMSRKQLATSQMNLMARHVVGKEVLRPSVLMRDIKLWTNYYCRWSAEDEDLSLKVMDTFDRIRMIQDETEGSMMFKSVSYRQPRKTQMP